MKTCVLLFIAVAASSAAPPVSAVLQPIRNTHHLQALNDGFRDSLKSQAKKRLAAIWRKSRPDRDPLRVTGLSLKRTTSSQDSSRLPDTALVMSMRDTTRFVFGYSQSGRLMSAAHDRLVNGYFCGISRYNYTYESSGLLSSKEESGYGCPHPYWRETYEYDDRGRLVQLTSYNGGEATPVRTVSRRYDDHDVLTNELVEGWGNGVQTYGMRWAVEFNENREEISYSWEAWGYEPWENGWRSHSKYGPEGELCQYLTEKKTDGVWSPEVRMTGTRRNSSVVTELLWEKWTGVRWENFQRSTYTAYADGSGESGLHETWSHGVWVERQRSSARWIGMSYEATGEELDEGKWLLASRSLYTVRDNGITDLESWRWSCGSLESYWHNTSLVGGTALLDHYESWKDGLIQEGHRTTTCYTGHNLLQRESDYCSLGMWEHDYKHVCTYDDQDRLVQVEQLRGDGSDWVPSDSTRGWRTDGWWLSDSSGNGFASGRFHRITLRYRDQTTQVSGENGNLPVSCALFQNYPNPFNPTTRIRYSIGVMSREGLVAARVRLAVYDLLGREVAVLLDEQKAPGTYQLEFDGTNLSSGVYFYRLTTGEFTQTKALLLLR